MKKWIITMATFVVVCAVAFWFFQESFVKEKPLSQEEAISHIEKLYNGEVSLVEADGNVYEMEFLRNGATYEVEIDAHTRRIEDLQVIKATQKSLLSEASIRKYVTQYVSGTIQSVQLTDHTYQVIVENERKIKNLTMDGYTGVIFSEIDTLKEADTPIKEETVLTKQQAIQIALKELKGEVDSVDYKETTDGGYYEIEIESDKDEAVILIHGVTGEVLSVERDDDD